MKNRQNIILWYKNVIRKVHKLSFDTFLKTIGAEMNAPGLSKRRPYFFVLDYIMTVHWDMWDTAKINNRDRFTENISGIHISVY